MEVWKRAQDPIPGTSLAEGAFSAAIPRPPVGSSESRAISQRVQPLPSFFVIGPPRTGTSWLHEVLGRRLLLPAPTKETRFFDRHFHRGVDWYFSHFPNANGSHVVGEIAPTYFASSEARERIAQTVPQAKVVCIFRNPAERVLSLYRIKRAYAMVPWTFEEALFSDPELMKSSRYATNLKAWREALGAEQVLPTFYDDLRNRPQDFMDTLADFIGFARFVLPKSEIRYVNDSERMTHPRSYYRTRSATMIADWCKAKRLDRVVAAVKHSSLRKLLLGGGPPFADLPMEMWTKLYELFRPEVEALEAMLNRDLSSWKFPPARSSDLASA